MEGVGRAPIIEGAIMCEGSCLSKQAMFCDVEERFAKDFCTLNQTMNGPSPLYVPNTRHKAQGKEPQVGPSISHPRKEKVAHVECMRTTVVFSGAGPPCRHEAESRSALPHASSHSCRRDRASPDGRARSVLRHPGVQANLSFPGPSGRRLIQPLGFLVALAGIGPPAGAYLGSTTFYTPKSRRPSRP